MREMDADVALARRNSKNLCITGVAFVKSYQSRGEKRLEISGNPCINTVPVLMM